MTEPPRPAEPSSVRPPVAAGTVPAVPPPAALSVDGLSTGSRSADSLPAGSLSTDGLPATGLSADLPAAGGRPNLPPAESWFGDTASAARRSWDRFAVGGFVLSLPGLAPLAVVLAVIGLRRIRRSGERGRRLALTALALSGCWVVALGVAAALDVYGQHRAGIGHSGPIADARVGQCFTADLGPGTLRTVTIRDCADAHAGEVYAKVGASLAGLDPQARETTATRQCATAFQRFVGRSYEASTLDMYYVVLDDRSVADGNVLCLLGRPGQSLTGSMRGRQR